MPNNAHRLLNHPTEDCLLNRIKLTDKQEQTLKSARDDIRQCIRHALRNWSDYLDNAEAFFTESANSAKAPTLMARFRMQGGMQYGTANTPAHIPPQEMDLDDGMFLATPSIQAAGETQPVLLVGGLFTVVEAALQDLCQARGWALEQKDTCVRVKLCDKDHSHVDVPIYAVPKARYDEIAQNFAKAMTEAQGDEAIAFSDRESIELLEEAYKSLASEEIMLAHREEGWKPSDPRRLEDWFDDARQRHGPQLRRICRLLKAWRDYQFEKGGPSSIALMWSVVQVYDQFGGTLDSRRDDLALLQVASELQNLFAGSVEHPVEGYPSLDEGWNIEMRQSFIAAARELSGAMHRAINQAETSNKVVAEFEAMFGSRLPVTAEAMVEMDAELATSLATVLDDLSTKTQQLPPTRKSPSERRYA